jgi:hypothetical protein
MAHLAKRFMSRLNAFRLTLPVLLLATFPFVASPQGNYRKGTIRKADAAGKSCDLMTGENSGYQIDNCGDFHGGQSVDYRVSGGKVYIPHEGGGKEYKCSITAELSGNLDPNVPSSQPPKYEKGTIEGYEIRYIVDQGGLGSHPRKATAYEMRGPDFIYEFALCGSFEAGHFTTGQVVEYSAGGDRLLIRHDNDKEWSCQIVAKEKVNGAQPPEERAQPGAGPSSPAPATVKLSITSVPDGADIEVDGNFSGNTPSDVEVPEGEHSIVVKKSGYNNWERKMKLVAGSNIHLNAEMEKTTTP